MKILISEKAKIDLLRVYSYVAERNSTAADSIARAIGGRMDVDEEFQR
jgi:plasmid stabilization system protein ParE